MLPLRARFTALLVGFGFVTCVSAATVAKLWVFGDSTVKDYKNSQDACSPVLAIAGWGQYIMDFLRTDSLVKVSNVIIADSMVLDNRANGGRAARSFITGGDSAVLKDAYAKMKPGDYMLIQFGHNDEADCVTYPDRCTPIADFKKYIGRYVDSVRSKGATPILITPMVRNAWPEYNTHDNTDGSKTNQQVGNFSLAMQQVAKEKGVPSVDLTQRSIDVFNSLGDTTTKYHYFRKVRTGTALPTGCTSIDDGTHFQPNGAKEMARQIYYGLRSLRKISVKISDTALGTVVGTSNGVKNKANTAYIQLTNDFRSGTGWYENDHNPTVKIEAKPKTGFVFVGWSGDATGTTNPLVLAMTRNYAITATFAKTGTGIGSRIAVASTRYEPTRRMLHVRLDSRGPAKVGVYALDGTSLYDRVHSPASLAQGVDIPLGGLRSGIYQVRCQQDGGSIQERFFVP